MRLLPLLLLLSGCEVIDLLGLGKDGTDTSIRPPTDTAYTGSWAYSGSSAFTTWSYTGEFTPSYTYDDYYTSYYSTWTTYCFTADTPVSTPDGERAIADLSVGDPVVAWDEVSGRPVVRPVTAVHRRTVSEIVSLDLGDSILETTAEHPFYRLPEGEWIEAGDLRAGDRLGLLDGGHLQPAAILDSRTLREPTEVFNLTVGGPEHTYFAGSVLVHNKTSTGSTWSYGTGTTPSGQAEVRAVHLAWDAGTADVLADGVNLATLFTGGNSDALATLGNDYSTVSLASGNFVLIDFRDPIGTSMFAGLPSLQGQHRYTAVGMGATQPPATATWPATVVVADDGVQTGSTTPTGHQITVWHAMTDARVFDVWACEGIDADADGILDPCDTAASPDHPGLTFGQWSTAIEVSTADQVVTVAQTGTATALQSFHLTGALQDWSYLYLGSDPADPAGPPIAHHHVHGQALAAATTL